MRQHTNNNAHTHTCTKLRTHNLTPVHHPDCRRAAGNICAVNASHSGENASFVFARTVHICMLLKYEVDGDFVCMFRLWPMRPVQWTLHSMRNKCDSAPWSRCDRIEWKWKSLAQVKIRPLFCWGNARTIRPNEWNRNSSRGMLTLHGVFIYRFGVRLF